MLKIKYIPEIFLEVIEGIFVSMAVSPLIISIIKECVCELSSNN